MARSILPLWPPIFIQYSSFFFEISLLKYSTISHQISIVIADLSEHVVSATRAFLRSRQIELESVFKQIAIISSRSCSFWIKQASAEISAGNLLAFQKMGDVIPQGREDAIAELMQLDKNSQYYKFQKFEHMLSWVFHQLINLKF